MLRIFVWQLKALNKYKISFSYLTSITIKILLIPIAYLLINIK